MNSSVAIYVAVLGLLCFGALAVVWVTIRMKGDFRAELSHGRTVFKLEAKEKDSERRTLRP
jgi:hypothetical protein